MGESPRTVTVKEVARQAEVSIATVSHVLHKTRFVSPELTNRVLDAVRDLGYYPNQLVGSLRKGKSYTVGLVMPSISNETFGLLAETIQQMLFGHGYNLIICNTAYDLTLEIEALNTLLMKKADAIVAIPTRGAGDKLREIRARGTPVVVVDRYMPELEIDTVRVDNVKGGHEAITHLIRLGHRRIGYIDRKEDQSHSVEQKIGYKRALEEYGLSYDPANIVRADGYDYESGTAAAKSLVGRNPELTALFAYYDITALGAMRGILDMGYCVPEEFSVVGYDGMPFTNASRPRLTTISFPVLRIAKTTCDLLMRRLEKSEGREEGAKDIVFVPKLIVRDSTAAPRDPSRATEAASGLGTRTSTANSDASEDQRAARHEQ